MAPQTLLVPPPIAPCRARRVLLTVDAVSGIWNYAMTLAEALGDGGTEVLVAALGPPPDAGQQTEARAVPRLTLRSAPFALEWMDEPWADVDRAAEWLLGLEREFAPEVVHLNSYAHGALPWRAPALVVAHHCLLGWWQSVERSAPPARLDTYRRRVGDGVRGAQVVVAPTHGMLDATRAAYGPLRDGRVIRNGADLERWRPLAKRPYVLAAGRIWDRAKNVAVLADVAARVAWPLHVAGATETPGRAGDAAPSPAGIRLLGNLRPLELAGWMGHATVFVHPALYEPFGLTPLEAASSGCALVLSDLPTLRELWDGAALFVDPRDADSVASAIRRLEEHTNERRQWAVRAHLRSRDFGAGQMHDAYSRLYAEMVASRSLAAAEAPVAVASTSTSTGTGLGF